MFDDLNKNSLPSAGGQSPMSGQGAPSPFNPPVPKPAQGNVDDLFAETDKTFPGQAPVKPAVFQPKPPAHGEEAIGADNAGARSGNQNKKIILLAGIVLIFIVLVGGGIYGFTILRNPASVTPVVEEEINNNAAKEDDGNQVVEENGQAEDNTANNQPENNQPANDQNNPDAVVDNNEAAPVPQKIDTDQDGLFDEEEESLGMDINNSDSDGDGLSDREEVKFYKTDPLQIDSDGDGFSDGEEVKNGYNPKGSGKLFEIK
jgi:hypothetical protein